MDPKQPIPLGIICFGAGPYVCLICEKGFATLKNGVKHLKGCKHMEDLAAMKSCCKITAERFTCKLCHNHTAANCDSFLLHFQQENHFKDRKFHGIRATVKLRKQAKKMAEPAQVSVPTFSPRLLQENCVIRLSKPKRYYCQVCRCRCQAWPQVAQHISGKRHKQWMEFEQEEESNDDNKETESSLSNDNFLDSWVMFESSENRFEGDSVDTSSSDSWEMISRSETIGSASCLPLSLENGIIALSYCPFCEVHVENFDDHIKGTNHKAAVKSRRDCRKE